uniref:Uncharacterized protein n=1 Tax=Knipowitschia caucasica TaxID=637954 RepID=A0AAV2K5T2_KNICA
MFPINDNKPVSSFVSFTSLLFTSAPLNTSTSFTTITLSPKKAAAQGPEPDPAGDRRALRLHTAPSRGPLRRLPEETSPARQRANKTEEDQREEMQAVGRR